MKTESEIYKACVDAGLKAGDIVRMSDGKIDYVTKATDWCICFAEHIAIELSSAIAPAKWPTHYARPTFVEYQGGDINGCFTLYREDNKGPCTHVIPYPTPPDQKSIEERLAALEEKIDRFLLPPKGKPVEPWSENR